MTYPKSKPIHNIFTKCAPFPSISNPYPFPYGFPLHWRALLDIHISAPTNAWGDYASAILRTEGRRETGGAAFEGSYGDDYKAH